MLFFVFLILVLGLVAIALTLLIPSYVLSYVKRNAVQQQNTSVSKTYTEELSVSIGEIQRTQDLLALIGSGEANTSASSVFKAIATIRPAGIHISSLSVRVSDDKTIMHVQGLSDTRESLRYFTNLLRDTKLFENIDLPISNFARDSDIPFSIETPLKI